MLNGKGAGKATTRSLGSVSPLVHRTVGDASNVDGMSRMSCKDWETRCRVGVCPRQRGGITAQKTGVIATGLDSNGFLECRVCPVHVLKAIHM